MKYVYKLMKVSNPENPSESISTTQIEEAAKRFVLENSNNKRKKGIHRDLISIEVFNGEELLSVMKVKLSGSHLEADYKIVDTNDTSGHKNIHNTIKHAFESEFLAAKKQPPTWTSNFSKKVAKKEKALKKEDLPKKEYSPKLQEMEKALNEESLNSLSLSFVRDMHNARTEETGMETLDVFLLRMFKKQVGIAQEKYKKEWGDTYSFGYTKIKQTLKGQIHRKPGQEEAIDFKDDLNKLDNLTDAMKLLETHLAKDHTLNDVSFDVYLLKEFASQPMLSKELFDIKQDVRKADLTYEEQVDVRGYVKQAVEKYLKDHTSTETAKPESPKF